MNTWHYQEEDYKDNVSIAMDEWSKMSKAFFALSRNVKVSQDAKYNLADEWFGFQTKRRALLLMFNYTFIKSRRDDFFLSSPGYVNIHLDKFAGHMSCSKYWLWRRYMAQERRKRVQQQKQEDDDEYNGYHDPVRSSINAKPGSIIQKKLYNAPVPTIPQRITSDDNSNNVRDKDGVDNFNRINSKLSNSLSYQNKQPRRTQHSSSSTEDQNDVPFVDIPQLALQNIKDKHNSGMKNSLQQSMNVISDPSPPAAKSSFKPASSTVVNPLNTINFAPNSILNHQIPQKQSLSRHHARLAGEGDKPFGDATTISPKPSPHILSPVSSPHAHNLAADANLDSLRHLPMRMSVQNAVQLESKRNSILMPETANEVEFHRQVQQLTKNQDAAPSVVDLQRREQMAELSYQRRAMRRRVQAETSVERQNLYQAGSLLPLWHDDSIPNVEKYASKKIAFMRLKRLLLGRSRRKKLVRLCFVLSRILKTALKRHLHVFQDACDKIIFAKRQHALLVILNSRAKNIMALHQARRSLLAKTFTAFRVATLEMLDEDDELNPHQTGVSSNNLTSHALATMSPSSRRRHLLIAQRRRRRRRLQQRSAHGIMPGGQISSASSDDEDGKLTGRKPPPGAIPRSREKEGWRRMRAALVELTAKQNQTQNLMSTMHEDGQIVLASEKQFAIAQKIFQRWRWEVRLGCPRHLFVFKVLAKWTLEDDLIGNGMNSNENGGVRSGANQMSDNALMSPYSRVVSTANSSSPSLMQNIANQPWARNLSTVARAIAKLKSKVLNEANDRIELGTNGGSRGLKKVASNRLPRSPPYSTKSPQRPLSPFSVPAQTASNNHADHENNSATVLMPLMGGYNARVVPGPSSPQRKVGTIMSARTMGGDHASLESNIPNFNNRNGQFGLNGYDSNEFYNRAHLGGDSNYYSSSHNLERNNNNHTNYNNNAVFRPTSSHNRETLDTPLVDSFHPLFNKGSELVNEIVTSARVMIAPWDGAAAVVNSPPYITNHYSTNGDNAFGHEQYRTGDKKNDDDDSIPVPPIHSSSVIRTASHSRSRLQNNSKFAPQQRPQQNGGWDQKRLFEEAMGMAGGFRR